MDTRQPAATSHIQHVALAQQLFGTLFAQNRTAIDFRRHMERNTRRQVCLNDASDNINRWPLRRHDEVNTRGTCLLREALDEEFDFLARGHHQIGELVHDDDDLRHWLIGQAFFLILWLSGHRVIANLHLTAQWRALCLCTADFLVEVCKVAHAQR